MMWWLIGAGILVVAVSVMLPVLWYVACGHDGEDTVVACFLGFVCLILCAALLLPSSVFLCKATWGSVPSYTSGECVGYLTGIYHRGLVWKTWEASMQIGVGELAALQAPAYVSVPDRAVRETMAPFVGSKARVRITYRGWLMQPYWRGESGYEVVGFEVVE